MNFLPLPPPLVAVRDALGDVELLLVGGSVRDRLLGRGWGDDFDLVTLADAPALARRLWKARVSRIPPVVYERFGTAMVEVGGTKIELVTARRESYDGGSRKPTVQPATLEDDALRRDFTLNALMVSLSDGELRDPLGTGLADLENRVLRTPLDPEETFRDDPLRMLRAVRFRRRFDLTPAPGLEDAIRASAPRLDIVSMERVRDEVEKMIVSPSAPEALGDLLALGLLPRFAPEVAAMSGIEQGGWHDADVWGHSLRVLRNVGPGDARLAWAALLHDVGKPPTRVATPDGHRWPDHDRVGAEIARTVLGRLRYPNRFVDEVALLVKWHMRLPPVEGFTDAAARRLLRDAGDLLEPLLRLVDADADALAPGVRRLDLAPYRARLSAVAEATPTATLESPLTGQEIMSLLGLPPGPEVGRVKAILLEAVLEGRLSPDDKDEALRIVSEAGALAQEIKMQ